MEKENKPKITEKGQETAKKTPNQLRKEKLKSVLKQNLLRRKGKV